MTTPSVSIPRATSPPTWAATKIEQTPPNQTASGTRRRPFFSSRPAAYFQSFFIVLKYASACRIKLSSACAGRHAPHARRFFPSTSAAPTSAVMPIMPSHSTTALLSPVLGLMTWPQVSHLPSLLASTWPVALSTRVSVSPQAQVRVLSPFAVQEAGVFTTHSPNAWV